MRVVNVVKRFCGVEVLRGVSISIDKGTVVSLLGPNGSGKTTLIRIIVGVLKPNSGTVVFNGRLLSYLPQEHGLFEELTGLDNVLFYARLYGLSEDYAKKRAKELLDRLELLEHAKIVVAKYSGGMAKKLSFTIALLPDADLLVLDEPTTGLDPSSRQAVWGIIEDEKRSGKAVLLSTHYMEEVERLSDYVYLMHRGAIVAEGTSEELKRKYAPKSVMELQLQGLLSKAVEVLRASGFEVITEGAKALKIYTDSPREAVPRMVSTLHASDVYVKSLRVVEPTLDDVFLRLTGRGLTEE